MVKKKSRAGGIIANRRARFDYELGDSLVVGLSLSGAETKALRQGHGHLHGAYVTVKDAAKGPELWLINATVTGTSNIKLSEAEQTRARKLLAKRREIEELMAARQQGQTIVPLEILNHGRFIKLRIAAGRGRKKYDKRQVLKKRAETRDINSAIKNRQV